MILTIDNRVWLKMYFRYLEKEYGITLAYAERNERILLTDTDGYFLMLANNFNDLNFFLLGFQEALRYQREKQEEVKS